MLDIATRNTLRNNEIRFDDLMKLSKEERRVVLLARVQEVYDLALAKTIETKVGSYPNPDCHSAGKMIELAARFAQVEDGKAQSEQPPAETGPTVSDVAKAAYELEQKRRQAA